jgi:predicted enzyme related to lactoylglutathione lyase
VTDLRSTSPAGAVIFTGDVDRLVKFYQAVTGMPIQVNDGSITVLGSDSFQVVIHALVGEPPGQASQPRNDAYVKPFFEVKSLSEIRKRVASLGGQADPPSKEWAVGRFRACEAVDPDGNPIQFRQVAP